mgnify:CR=1 FL=1
MKLNDLIKSVDCEKVVGNTDKEISAICQDSRKVAADSLLAAGCGYTIDGNEYIKKKIKKLYLCAITYLCKSTNNLNSPFGAQKHLWKN